MDAGHGQEPGRLLRDLEKRLALCIATKGGAFEHISTDSLELRKKTSHNTHANRARPRTQPPKHAQLVLGLETVFIFPYVPKRFKI